MLPPDLQRLSRIRDYCELIEATVKRFGGTYEHFAGDVDFQQSISFSILQIGELAGSLSEDVRSANKAPDPAGDRALLRRNPSNGFPCKRRREMVVWLCDTNQITNLFVGVFALWQKRSPTLHPPTGRSKVCVAANGVAFFGGAASAAPLFYLWRATRCRTMKRCII